MRWGTRKRQCAVSSLGRNEGEIWLRRDGARRLQDAARRATGSVEEDEVRRADDGEREEEEHGTVLLLNCMEMRCAEVHETFVEACLEHFRVWRLPTSACPPDFQHPRIVIYAMLLRSDPS